MDENATELDAGNNDSKKYKVEAIWNITVYARESESGHLSGLYYLVSWRRYLEKKNTWEPVSAIQHLKRLISLCHKDHPNKTSATSQAIDIVPPIARPIVKPMVTKKKQSQPANNTNKRAKNWAVFDFYHIFGRIWVISRLDILSRIIHNCMSLYVTAGNL